MMNDWQQYKRKGLSELKPYQAGDDLSRVSILAFDRENGSPKEGDMIARNPKDHSDQWLVAKAYFEENLEPADPVPVSCGPSPLNPGIAGTVAWLQKHGWDTTDSGDGQTHDFGCDLKVPYVHMYVDPFEIVQSCDRLCSFLLAEGISVESQNEFGTAPAIEVTYNPADNRPAVLSLYNVCLPAET